MLYICRKYGMIDLSMTAVSSVRNYYSLMNEQIINPPRPLLQPLSARRWNTLTQYGLHFPVRMRIIVLR